MNRDLFLNLVSHISDSESLTQMIRAYPDLLPSDSAYWLTIIEQRFGKEFRPNLQVIYRQLLQQEESINHLLQDLIKGKVYKSWTSRYISLSTFRKLEAIIGQKFEYQPCSLRLWYDEGFHIEVIFNDSIHSSSISRSDLKELLMPLSLENLVC